MGGTADLDLGNVYSVQEIYSRDFEQIRRPKQSSKIVSQGAPFPPIKQRAQYNALAAT